jgi:PAS domain S-box-containing protein
MNSDGEFVERQPYLEAYTGQSWEEYCGSGWITTVHPDDRSSIMADWAAAVSTGSTYFTQGRIWSAKYQGYRAFQTRGIPVRDDAGRIVEWLGALTDIQDSIDIQNLLQRTETDLALSIQALRTSEARHRESEERFGLLANSAPVLIWMSGTDKLCTFFNQRWLEFTGRPLEAEMGNGWVEGVHPDDVRQCFESYSAAFDARHPFEISYRLRRHDGEYRWVLDFGVPHYDSGGEFCGYLGSAIDITERRRAEESNLHFAHMQRLAQIGELSAAIAHELRQPLHAIKLHAQTVEMIAGSPTPPLREVQEIAADIAMDASRANDVIERIRTFVRPPKSARQTLEVEKLVKQVASLVSDDARKRQVEIVLEISDDLSQVRGDQTQIMQVLVNLVLNGMDSMENVAAADRRLVLRTAPRDGQIDVSVSDYGTGISPEVMPRLFESFFTTKSDGMGIGLSISRSIVAMHEGHIWAENNAAGGATFYFTLPTIT